MRVILKYFNSSGQIVTDPCENGYSYGETEDYTVNIIDPTLDIDNLILDSTAVFPNPFNSSLSVKLPNQYNAEEVLILLYDIRGREIKTVKFGTNSLIVQNDLGALSKGTYFLKVINISGKAIYY